MESPHPRGQQIARVAGSRGIDPPEVERIVSQQARREARIAAADDVLFNDGASGTGTVTIDLDAANVATSLTLFENTTRDYVLTGAFGISAGSLTKNGAGSLTIATANTYSGAPRSTPATSS